MRVANGQRPEQWREQLIDRALLTRDWTTETLVRELRLWSPHQALMVFSRHSHLVSFMHTQPNVVALIEGRCEMARSRRERQAPYLAWYGFDWQGDRLELVLLPGHQDFAVCTGASFEQVSAFSVAALNYIEPPSTRVSRYAGCWFESAALEAEILKVTWGDLVLPESILQGVRQSVEGFFANRDTFAAMGCAWRRGVLLIGPPGTGKTMICKAVGSALPQFPFLYISDMRADDGEAVDNIFSRARQLVPCVLVIEDIDGLLRLGNQSLFLNELDGFTDNDGLLVLATSNHPERIDPALLNRPSRFDRVFHIDLPALEERREYCRRMLQRMLAAADGGEDLDAEALSLQVAQATDGFTPAYLKEAFSCAAMQMAGTSSIKLDGQFAAVLMKQVSDLRAYLKLVRKPEDLAQMRSHDDTMGLRRL